MTTRRTFLTLAGGVAVLAGCARRVPAGPAVPDAVLVDTNAGLALLRGSATRVLGAGLPTPSGTAVWTTGDGTILRRVETRTGEVGTEIPLPGRWVPRVVAPDDTQVALTAPGGDRYRPVGRDRTTILVAADGGIRHRLELARNYEPDAFARAGTALFVLEWLGPTGPAVGWPSPTRTSSGSSTSCRYRPAPASPTRRFRRTASACTSASAPTCTWWTSRRARPWRAGMPGETCAGWP